MQCHWCREDFPSLTSVGPSPPESECGFWGKLCEECFELWTLWISGFRVIEMHPERRAFLKERRTELEEKCRRRGAELAERSGGRPSDV